MGLLGAFFTRSDFLQEFARAHFAFALGRIAWTGDAKLANAVPFVLEIAAIAALCASESARAVFT